MRTNEFAHFSGHRESEHEIVAREQASLLLDEPSFRFRSLATRTMSITARLREEVIFLALLTPKDRAS
jgi:hypothetical protein